MAIGANTVKWLIFKKKANAFINRLGGRKLAQIRILMRKNLQILSRTRDTLILLFAVPAACVFFLFFLQLFYSIGSPINWNDYVARAENIKSIPKCFAFEPNRVTFPADNSLSSPSKTCYTIAAVTYNSANYTSLVNDVASRNGLNPSTDIAWFASESALDRYLLRQPYDIQASYIFDPPDAFKPYKISYTVQFPHSQDQGRRCKWDLTCVHPWKSIAIPMQYHMDQAILRLNFPSASVSADFYRFPLRTDIGDRDPIAEDRIVHFVLVVALATEFGLVLRMLMREKCLGVGLSFGVVNCSPHVNLCTWFMLFTVLELLVALVTCITAIIFNVKPFIFNDFFLVWSFFFTSFELCVSIAFVAHAFLTAQNQTLFVTILLFGLQYFAAEIALTPLYRDPYSNPSRQERARQVIAMLPCFPFVKALMDLSYSDYNKGIRWGERDTYSDTWPVGRIMNYFFGGTCVWIFLAWYFHSVLPVRGTRGQGRSYVFPLLTLIHRYYPPIRLFGDEDAIKERLQKEQQQQEGQQAVGEEIVIEAGGGGKGLKIDLLAMADTKQFKEDTDVRAERELIQADVALKEDLMILRNVTRLPEKGPDSGLIPFVAGQAKKLYHSFSELRRKPESAAAALAARIKARMKGGDDEEEDEDEDPILNAVYLQVELDQTVVLLGPRGAGKSTAIMIACGLEDGDAGDVLVGGDSSTLKKTGIRMKTGVLFDFDPLYHELTTVEHMQLYSMLKGVSSDGGNSGGSGSSGIEDNNISRILDACQLTNYAIVPVSNFTLAMKRRLSLAIALIGDPKFLFLDGLTRGLSPSEQRTIWNILARVRPGKAVLMTTHRPEEAEILADKVSIVLQGRMQALGTPSHLKKKFKLLYGMHVATVGAPSPILKSYILQQLPDAKVVEETDKGIRISIERGTTGQLQSLFFELETYRTKLGIKGFTIQQRTIRDHFEQMIADMKEAAMKAKLVKKRMRQQAAAQQ